MVYQIGRKDQQVDAEYVPFLDISTRLHLYYNIYLVFIKIDDFFQFYNIYPTYIFLWPVYWNL